MSTGQRIEVVNGIFLSETKNRFLCDAIVKGKAQRCYIPSSCRLDNFLDLDNQNILLTPVKSPKATTKYAVLALPYKQKQILLNPSMANKAISDNLKNRRFSFIGPRKIHYCESRVEDYRADIFIPDTNSIVEIKSVISSEKHALFPTVHSERACDQLESLCKMMACGYTVFYFIVALNPYTNSISINPSNPLHSQLINAQNLGLVIKGYVCELSSNSSTQLKITKEVPIVL